MLQSKTCSNKNESCSGLKYLATLSYGFYHYYYHHHQQQQQQQQQ